MGCNQKRMLTNYGKLIPENSAMIKGTVMHIEKALINHCLSVTKVS